MLTKLLTNLDINYLAKKIKLKDFHACVSKNVLRQLTPKLGSYIINLDDDDEIGLHWCAFIIYPTVVCYFDSYGLPPPSNLIRFAKRFLKNIRIIFSKDRIQHHHSVYCGYFCLYFIYFMTTKGSRNLKKPGLLLNIHNNNLYKSNSSIERKENDFVLKSLFAHIVDDV